MKGQMDGMNGGRTDVDIPELGETHPELLHIAFVRFHFISLSILRAALLLRVKAQILQQDDLPVRGFADGVFGLGTNAVFCEDDFFSTTQASF